MTVRRKIKFIRNFRGMTQKELGVGIGFDEKGADNRIAQYETNYRVPKKDTLLQIAKVLDVNPLNFISEVSGSAEDIMQTFFWLDEDNPGAINLFQLVRIRGSVTLRMIPLCVIMIVMTGLLTRLWVCGLNMVLWMILCGNG